MISKITHVTQRIEFSHVNDDAELVLPSCLGSVVLLGAIFNGEFVVLWEDDPAPLSQLLQRFVGAILGADPTHADAKTADLAGQFLLSPDLLTKLASSEAIQTDIAFGATPSHISTLAAASSEGAGELFVLGSDAEVEVNGSKKAEARQVPSMSAELSAELDKTEDESILQLPSYWTEFLHTLGSVDKDETDSKNPSVVDARPIIADIDAAESGENTAAVVEGTHIFAEVIDTEITEDGVAVISSTPKIAGSIQPEQTGITSLSLAGMPRIMRSQEIKSRHQHPLLVVVDPRAPVCMYSDFTGGQAAIVDTFSELDPAAKNAAVGVLSAIANGAFKIADTNEVNSEEITPTVIIAAPHATGIAEQDGAVSGLFCPDGKPEIASASKNDGSDILSAEFHGAPLMVEIHEAEIANFAPFSPAGDPKLADVGENEGTTPLSPLLLGIPSGAAVVEQGNAGVGSLSVDGQARTVGADLADTDGQFPLMIVAAPYYRIAFDSEGRLLQTSIADLDVALTPGQSEGCERPLVHAFYVCGVYKQGAAQNGAADDASASMVVAKHSAQPVEKIVSSGTVSSGTNVHPSISGATGTETDGSVSPVLQADAEHADATDTENSGTALLQLQADPKGADATDNENTALSLLLIVSDPENAQSFGGGGSGVFSVGQSGELKATDARGADSWQLTGTPIVITPRMPVATDGGQMVTQMSFDHIEPTLADAQSGGFERPSVYSLPLRCAFSVCNRQAVSSACLGGSTLELDHKQADALTQENAVVSGAEAEFLYSLVPMLTADTGSPPMPAIPVLGSDQAPVYFVYLGGTAGADVEIDASLADALAGENAPSASAAAGMLGSVADVSKEHNRTTGTGVAALYYLAAAILTADKRTAFGGNAVAFPVLRDILSLSIGSIVNPPTDVEPALVPPDKLDSSGAAGGTSKAEYSWYYEIADLDTAHVTTIDLLAIRSADNDTTEYCRSQLQAFDDYPVLERENE